MVTSRKHKARRTHLNGLDGARQARGSSDRPDKPSSLSIFYGYPPELIARWCGVTVSTARRWKAGTMRPARAALRLFCLHRDGKALDDHWSGWTVREGVLTDPEGNSTTQAQLRAYALVMQLAAELVRNDPDARGRYLALLASA